MKFEILNEDSGTSARLGRFTFKGRKIETPIFWLGAVPQAQPKPWEIFKPQGLMVNAFNILEENMIEEIESEGGIHQYMKYNGLIMMDSGGFQFLRRDKITIDPNVILEIYERTAPDIGFILDHPFDPTANRLTNRRRWKSTMKNTRLMLDNSDSILLVPTIHGYKLKEIRKACLEVKEMADPKIVAIGSLVPLMLLSKRSKENTRNWRSSRDFLVKAIRIVREEFEDSLLHVFGIGGTTTMHLMFALGVDSVDSMSWRLKAAYGAIQLPGVGDKFISPRGRRKKLEKEEYKILQKCSCPTCRGKSLAKRRRSLDNSIPSTFKARAIHNAFVFEQEERRFKRALKKGESLDFVKKSLSKSPLLKHLANLDSRC